MPALSPTAYLMAINQTANPVTEVRGERIHILDSLRGIAVLGILLMNIPIFAYPRMVMFSPNLIDFTGLNFYAWYGVEWMVEGSQRALFSMLFGAGMLLFISRQDRTKGLLPAEYFFRRQLWLLVFGFFNAYVLLWPGDILYHYAIIGMVLFAFIRLQPKHLLAAALVCMLFQTLRENADFYRSKLMVSRGEAIARMDTSRTALTPLQKDRLSEYHQFKKAATKEAKTEMLKQIVGNVQGTYPQVYSQLSEISFRVETTGFFHFIFFDVLVFMFIGMAFYKNGILTGHASVKWYWLLFLVGMGLGLTLSYLRLKPSLQYDFDEYAYTKNVVFEFYQLSKSFRSLGIFGGIMLLYKSGAFKWWFALMRPVGKMAFTNYLTQSLICGLVFYGPGLGLYGKLQFHQLYYVVAAIWVLQITWSHLWLRYYSMGPMEWLWRSLTYWEKQPVRKSDAARLSTPTSKEPAAV